MHTAALFSVYSLVSFSRESGDSVLGVLVGGTFIAFALLCLSAAYMQDEAASEADNDLTSV
jgi:hypothetical protein